MKIIGRQIRLAGSDLSNHLACRHLTTLELQVARRERTPPVWAAGCAAASGEAERAVEVVIRSGGHEAGSRDEGDDDPATVAVLGFAEANSRDDAGVFVGGTARRGIRGRKIPGVGVCGVLPA